LLGANGAGKSTAMRAVTGLLRPVDGSIVLNDARIEKRSAHTIAASGMALVPEGRQVFPELSVRDNILLGAYARRGVDIHAEIESMLQRFPRLRERLHSRAGLLSGGEQQMLAIARGLMGRPRCLLLDEPTLGLAPLIVDEISDTIAKLARSGLPILLAEQNAAMALGVADRAYVLASGRIAAEGTPASLRDSPVIQQLYFGATTSKTPA